MKRIKLYVAIIILCLYLASCNTGSSDQTMIINMFGGDELAVECTGAAVGYNLSADETELLIKCYADAGDND
jgi:hypothetical protein